MLLCEGGICGDKEGKWLYLENVNTVKKKKVSKMIEQSISKERIAKAEEQ